jgi:hypothetical protein
MTEMLVHHSYIHSKQMDRFVIRIETRADGRAEITLHPGPTQPVFVFPVEPATIELQMPYTPDNQPLLLQITKERKE